jgi:hypothetical protein
MVARRAVDQLHIDPDPTGLFSNTSLKDMFDIQFLNNLPDFHGLPLVLTCGVAGDDEQRGDPREVGYDFLCNAISEILWNFDVGWDWSGYTAIAKTTSNPRMTDVASGISEVPGLPWRSRLHLAIRRPSDRVSDR